MKKIWSFSIYLFLIVSMASSQDFKKSEEEDPDIGARLVIWKKEGLVPNEEVAIKIAEAILVNVYGEEVLENRPFIAALTDNGTVWYIKGTFPHTIESGYWGGGVPHIKISKSDGRIIGYIHGK